MGDFPKAHLALIPPFLCLIVNVYCMGKVKTYKNAGKEGVFSQIILDNGERVLISIAANEVKIFRLVLWGSIPKETVWMYPDIADLVVLLTTNKYIDSLFDVLDLFVERVIECKSIRDMQNKLDEFINNLN